MSDDPGLGSPEAMLLIDPRGRLLTVPFSAAPDRERLFTWMIELFLGREPAV